MSTLSSKGEVQIFTFDMHVRGEIPRVLAGSLVVPTNRRNKERSLFARWHDSQADLLRLDLYPGAPGRIRAHVLPVDSSGSGLDCGVDHGDSRRPTYPALEPSGYITQPNHGINIAGGTVWATNLLFGAPLEVDLETWQPRRILRYVQLDEVAPRMTGTAHFAWSLDRRYAYFEQSPLQRESPDAPVRAGALSLIELDVRSGAAHIWKLVPPPEDAAPETANFHSAFCFEEDGKRYVGLLRTGALLERLGPHPTPDDHRLIPASASTVWIIPIDHRATSLQAQLLPGIRELDGLALSHLDIDASGGDGFVLYANFKEADVAEETHGQNIFGERPELVAEHYSGMTVEPLNYGLVLRYERRGGRSSIRTFSRPYDPASASLGHSWLPINIETDPKRRRLFCTFGGFRPRLLSRYIADAYPTRVVEPSRASYVPPLLMRLDASTLQPDHDKHRGYLSYSEPVAIAVAGDGTTDYVCTFSPQIGLRIYLADDLTRMVCQAESPNLIHWQDTHFRPDPAHMQFAQR